VVREPAHRALRLEHVLGREDVALATPELGVADDPDTRVARESSLGVLDAFEPVLRTLRLTRVVWGVSGRVL
jgi:hypothetical protein